jgi:hypothetical protein
MNGFDLFLGRQKSAFVEVCYRNLIVWQYWEKEDAWCQFFTMGWGP